LAGYGMGLKIKMGCKILKILVAGYGMKLSWRDRDSFLFVGGMWNILSLKVGCGMTKRGASLYNVPFQSGSGIG